MSSALKTRVAKLHGNSISDVNSQIIVKRADIILKNVLHGTNANKVIRIMVRL